MKTDVIRARVTEDFKKEVQKLASKNGLQISEYLRMILIEKIKESEA